MTKTEADLREIIQFKVKQTGRKEVALDLGVTESYVSMLTHNNKFPISSKIAERLGYRIEKAVTKLFLPIT